MLEASLDRRYSANPGEAFSTGGGLHTFHNFDKEDDARIMSLREGFRQSVNLVFIRLMRDIVEHYLYEKPASLAACSRTPPTSGGRPSSPASPIARAASSSGASTGSTRTRRRRRRSISLLSGARADAASR